MLASTSLTRKTGIGEPKLFVEGCVIGPSCKENTLRSQRSGCMLHCARRAHVIGLESIRDGRRQRRTRAGVEHLSGTRPDRTTLQQSSDQLPSSGLYLVVSCLCWN